MSGLSEYQKRYDADANDTGFGLKVVSMVSPSRMEMTGPEKSAARISCAPIGYKELRPVVPLAVLALLAETPPVHHTA